MTVFEIVGSAAVFGALSYGIAWFVAHGFPSKEMLDEEAVKREWMTHNEVRFGNEEWPLNDPKPLPKSRDYP